MIGKKVREKMEMGNDFREIGDNAGGNWLTNGPCSVVHP